MTIGELIKCADFQLVTKPIAQERKISQPFCCDLLSIAMSKAPENSAWVTVMANINTLAVASLTDVACVILAENVLLEESLKEKAEEKGIILLKTELPIFEAALKIWEKM